MSKRFFSSESAHGSSTSHGFANDTVVTVFDSKAARDKYVKESDNISCQDIPAKMATLFATNYSYAQDEDIKPVPFTGQFWGIIDYADLAGEVKPDGYIGILQVCVYYGPGLVERLHRKRGK